MNALLVADSIEHAASLRAMAIVKAGKFDAYKLRQCLIDLESLPAWTGFEDKADFLRFGWLKNISEFPQLGPIALGHYPISNIPDDPRIDFFRFWEETEEEKKAIKWLNAETKKTIRIYRTICIVF